MQIISIPAFSDNYIWLLHQPGSHRCAVVDPGDAAPVLERLNHLGLSLDAILLTHHHADHTGGVAKLTEHFPECTVYAGADMPASFDFTPLKDGQTLSLPFLGTNFDVIATPGHTLSHICYFDGSHLFVGDTLFNGGCGRLFEGTPQQMYTSLTGLAALPNETKVYCAHEYTVANLKFALAVEPGNAELRDYFKQMSKLSQQGVPTIPMELLSQKQFNPFLRCLEPSVRASVENHSQQLCQNGKAVFTALRRWKDNF